MFSIRRTTYSLYKVFDVPCQRTTHICTKSATSCSTKTAYNYHHGFHAICYENRIPNYQFAMFSVREQLPLAQHLQFYLGELVQLPQNSQYSLLRDNRQLHQNLRYSLLRKQQTISTKFFMFLVREQLTFVQNLQCPLENNTEPLQNFIQSNNCPQFGMFSVYKSSTKYAMFCVKSIT